MIYTVTLNPAIDYVINMDAFHIGEINRSQYDYKEAGGKGINVSRVLKRFGEESIALGFSGGFTGKFITDSLTEMDIRHDFITLEEDTRVNVKLKTTTEESEVNGVSPRIEEKEYQQLLTKLQHLQKEDIVVLAGSLPHALPVTVYRDLVTMLNEQGIKSVLDTSGVPLTEAVKASPYFVKPNNYELAELFSQEAKDEKDIITLANRLHEEYQIPHVLISMAKAGAIYLGEDGVYKITAPSGQAQNSVGAGDSTVAGFIYKWQETQHAKETAAFAVACGSATAFSKTLCTKKEAETLLSEVKVKEL